MPLPQEHECQASCVIGTATDWASGVFIPEVDFSQLVWSWGIGLLASSVNYRTYIMAYTYNFPWKINTYFWKYLLSAYSGTGMWKLPVSRGFPLLTTFLSLSLARGTAAIWMRQHQASWQHSVRWASEQQGSLYLCDALIFLVSMFILEQCAEEWRRNELLHRDLWRNCRNS